MDLGVAMVRAIIQKFAYFVTSKLGHSAGDLHFLPVGVPAASYKECLQKCHPTRPEVW